MPSETYPLYIDNVKVIFADYDTSNSSQLWNEIEWLKGFTSDKARKLFELFDAGKFAQAARYYDHNKF